MWHVFYWIFFYSHQFPSFFWARLLKPVKKQVSTELSSLSHRIRHIQYPYHLNYLLNWNALLNIGVVWYLRVTPKSCATAFSSSAIGRIWNQPTCCILWGTAAEASTTCLVCFWNSSYSAAPIFPFNDSVCSKCSEPLQSVRGFYEYSNYRPVIITCQCWNHQLSFGFWSLLGFLF